MSKILPFPAKPAPPVPPPVAKARDGLSLTIYLDAEKILDQLNRKKDEPP
jgi:hypothetical protein